ncbi:ABC transporter permease [Streptomyces sp. JNUCC 64]
MSAPVPPDTTPQGRRTVRRWISAVAVTVVLPLGLLGPPLAPHSPTAVVAPPHAAPGAGHWLGGDHLGRDVLSRLLHGSPSVVITTLAATAVAVTLGTLAGLLSALLEHRRSRLGGLVTRPLDALAAVPPVLTLLLVLTTVPGRPGVIAAATAASVPLCARVVRAAAGPVLRRPHVELAAARGESRTWLLGHEVLPLVAPTVAAEAGLRFVLTLYLVTAAGFLGVATTGTDWGTLIVEALPGATLQPVALLAPLLLVAVLAVSVNLLTDRARHDEQGPRR